MKTPPSPNDRVQLAIRSLRYISRVTGYPLVFSTAILDQIPALLEASSPLPQADQDEEDEEEPEFCLAVTFDPFLISGAVYRGIFPMTITVWDVPIMALKLHNERCTVRPSDIATSRSVRRRARRFVFTIDQRREEALAFIRARHESCWLSPQLWRSFCTIAASPTDHHGMRIHSFEVCEPDTGRLVAAELGYTMGGVYTSLTGAFDSGFPGAGSVQLAVTGAFLERCGFACWDLGMVMDYKVALGGQPMSRLAWQTQVASLRDWSAAKAFVQVEPMGCREIIDQVRQARADSAG